MGEANGVEAVRVSAVYGTHRSVHRLGGGAVCGGRAHCYLAPSSLRSLGSGPGPGPALAQVAVLLGKDRVMRFQHGRFNRLCLIAQPLC